MSKDRMESLAAQRQPLPLGRLALHILIFSSGGQSAVPKAAELHFPAKVMSRSVRFWRPPNQDRVDGDLPGWAVGGLLSKAARLINHGS